MCDRLNLLKIYDISRSENCIQQLQNWGLIPNEPNYLCPKCDSPLRLCPSPDIDKYSWRCWAKVSQRKQKAKQCNTERSLRSGTFFGGSHLSIYQILGFVNFWVSNASHQLIADQLDINVSTVTDWASFCREVVYDSMVSNKEKLGGTGRTVQIDEAKFGKRKYEKGHKVEGQWVFGGIEEESGRVFMIPVDKRDSSTLIPIIKDWVHPGTTIVSDCWRAYSCLTDNGYTHMTVNHKLNFKDPLTGAHTNRIEASWRAAKDNLKSGSRKKSFFPSHLAKYMFLKMCRLQSLNPTITFFKMAGELYNPINANVETIQTVDIDSEIVFNEFN